ncbi:MAG: chemotaxis protein CheW [Candidatus Sumerlaeia bacterium]
MAGENGKQATAELKEFAGKYLTMILGDEHYGINITKVREIINLQDITRVPETRPELKGVINLRGQVIAVIDLRIKFGMEEREYDDDTCIVIVESGKLVTGLVVDRVDEVADLENTDLEPAPRFHTQVDTQFISAMGKAKNKIIILLDTDYILESTKCRSNILSEESSF